MTPFGTPPSAMEASVQQITAVLQQAGHPHPATVATTIVDQVHQSHLVADAVTTRTYSQ